MSKTIRKALEDARTLLEDPRHWVKEVSAVDEAGRNVLTYGDRAVRWCLVGAIDKVTFGETVSSSTLGSLYTNVLKHIGGVQGWPSSAEIINFNDHPGTKHEDVLDLLDRAIAGCE